MDHQENKEKAGNKPKTSKRKEYELTEFAGEGQHKSKTTLIAKEGNIVGETVYINGKRQASLRGINRDYEMLEEVCDYLNIKEKANKKPDIKETLQK